MNLYMSTVDESVGLHWPKPEIVTIAQTRGEGKLKIYDGNNVEITPETNLCSSLKQNQFQTLSLVGEEPGEVELTVRYGNDKIVIAEDKVMVTVAAGVDLDVDSDNTDGYNDLWTRTPEEDKMEDGKSGNPGKIFQVNDGDVDGDGIPDFADGFDITDKIADDGIIDAEPADNPEAFGIPMVLEIDLTGSKYEPTDFVYTFEYKASDPKDTNVEEKEDEAGNKTYTFSAPAGFRIWTNKEKIRKKNNVDASADKGDFVPANVQISAADMKMDEKKHTFYVEAVPGAESLAGDDVKIKIKAEIPGKHVLYEDVVRLNPILMQFVVPGENGEIVPTNYVGVSYPNPQVKLKELEKSDIQISTATKKATVTLRCNEILDPVADNLPPGEGEIKEVEVYLDYSENPIKKAKVRRVTGDEHSFWRQHPYKGKFDDIEIKIPITGGSHNIRVKTTKNAAGLTGYDEANINISNDIIGGGGGYDMFVNIFLEEEPASDKIDKLVYYFGNRWPLDSDPVFEETGTDTLVFAGTFNEHPANITITDFSGFHEESVDSFTVEFPFLALDEIVYLKAKFEETGPKTGIFRYCYTIPETPLQYKWEVTHIDNGRGAGAGVYNPMTIRVKGINDITDFQLKLQDKIFEIEKGDEGWCYIKGKSKNIFSPSQDPENPSTEIISLYSTLDDAIAKMNFSQRYLVTYFIYNKMEKLEVARIRAERQKVDIGMDSNRDGTIDFKEDKKYVFWVNDDDDYIHNDENMDQEDDNLNGEGNSGTPFKKDCLDDKIDCLRDLEDFSRLNLKISEELRDRIKKKKDIKFFFRFEPEEGDPKINLFEAINDNFDYIENKDTGNQQIGKDKILQIRNEEMELDPKYLSVDKEIYPFIFEGRQTGKGTINFYAKDSTGRIVCTSKIELEIKLLKELYDKFYVGHSGDVSLGEVDKEFKKNWESTFPVESDGKYILLVHGWNVFEDEKESSIAETVFKRLWWQGNKYRIGLFSWPTPTSFDTFNRGEFRAWNSGYPLKNLLKKLNETYKGNVNVLAHSMGNIALGEALRIGEGKVVNAYIATQAAISVHHYDNTINYPPPQVYPTPNCIGYYYFGNPNGGNKPYLTEALKKANKIVNFHNSADYALNLWKTNNSDLRPDRRPLILGGFFKYYYEDMDGNGNVYTPTAGDRFYRIPTMGKEIQEDLRYPRDRFELFSYAVRARYYCVGAYDPAQNNNKGIKGFSESFNLQDSPLNYDSQHYSHSRQFRSNIIDEKAYYKKVIDIFSK